MFTTLKLDFSLFERGWMVNWSVRRKDLNTPARAGGINAEKGFLFQRSYAAWLLSGLLTNAEGVVALRYEGAQDVDLWLHDGAEIYVQLKGYETTEIDWQGVRTIVSRFVDDLQDARKNASPGSSPRLTFRLVATGTVSDVDVLNLSRGVHHRRHAPRMTRELKGGKLLPSLRDDIFAVLTGLKTEFYPATLTRDIFRLMAEARLSRFGIGADDVDRALRTLLDRLTWRETTRGSDVLDWITEYLPDEHPCSNKGALVSFAARSRGGSGSPELFYTSQSDIWQGITNDLDVPRDMAPALRTALLSDSGSKFLIYGPSGAGKSTLARRVLWDLQLEGRIVALELRGVEPSDEEWSSLIRLANRLKGEGGPTVVLLIDDLHDFPLMADRISDLDGASGIRLVATTWFQDAGGLSLGGGLLEFPLRTISQGEAAAAATRLSRELATVPTSELEPLLLSGQFVVLNIALLEGGDVKKFGQRLLKSVQVQAPGLADAYVDLCVCGIGDRSVPLDVISRIHTNAVDLVTSVEMAGLVLEGGPGRIRSGHRMVAEAVVEASSIQRATRILALAGAVNPADSSERRFGLGMLEDLLASGISLSPLSSHIARLAISLATPGDYLDVRRSVRILELAGKSTEAGQVDTLATFSRVATGPDAAAYRGDHGRRDPEGTFDNLLGFYSSNSTTWGWRNFLHLAKELDSERRTQALSLARNRSELGLDPGTAKVVIDLMNSGNGLPEWAGDFAAAILRRVPDDVSVARAVAQLIIDHLRSAELFRTLLNYASEMIGTAGDPLLLARNLGSAARYGDAPDRRRLLNLLINLLGTGESNYAHARILQTCAIVADKGSVKRVEALLGPAIPGEHARLNAARHILRKKVS